MARATHGRRALRAFVYAAMLLGPAPVAVFGGPDLKLVVTVPAEGAFVGAKFILKGTLTGAPRGAIVKLGDASATVAENGTFEFPIAADHDGVRKMRVVYAAAGAPEVFGLRNVTVDTTPPMIEVLVPAAGSVAIAGAKVTVTGRVIDVAPVELRVNGRETPVVEDGKFEAQVDLPAEGSVTVTISAEDLAGNVAAPVVRTITRWADPGPPRLVFERTRQKDLRVIWIAGDFSRIMLGEDTAANVRTIRERDGKAAGFATPGRPLVVLIRTAVAVPSDQFDVGMKTLRSIGGVIQITAPPAGPGTSAPTADSIEITPDASKDGSWHVRLDSLDWPISARDARALAVAGWAALPPPTKAAIDGLGAQLKAARKSRTVRFRLSEAVPVRLFDEVRWGGCAGASVMLEASGASVAAAVPGAAKRWRPTPTRIAFQSRFDHRAASKGTDRVDVCVEDALAWLAAHQSEGGRWETAGWRNWCDRAPAAEANALEGAGNDAFDVGVTGLALLAFLGAGYTDRSDGPFGKVVADGLSFLRTSQDREGCFGERSIDHYVYNHAIAACAMIEAYGMTRNPAYEASAQLGLDFIAICRNPYFAWRYGVKPGDNDTSVTAWMTHALHSAMLCNLADEKAGEPGTLDIDDEALEGIKAWIDKMTDPDTGRVGYQQRGTGPSRPTDLTERFPFEKSESMTAAGMLCRMIVGENPKTSDVIKKGAELCVKLLPTWNTQDGSIDMYYWYFATYALFQVGGDPWKRWETAMNSGIIGTQHKDTTYCRYKGSWDPIDPWGLVGGRVYSTAIMALTCEVKYR